MRPVDLAADETAAFVLAHVATGHQRILDVGCGNGLVAQGLQLRGHEVVAIDESAAAVEQALTLGVDARLASWPDFADGPLDVVLFARSLHHIGPLAEAVAQAERVLAPSGLVIVDEFERAQIDPATLEWFYGIVRLLKTSQRIADQDDSFATKLLRSRGEYACWAQHHDRGLHTAIAMWSALRNRFEAASESSAPYLYRYLCPLLAEDESGYTIACEVLDMERRLARLGALSLIGRRFVGRKR